MSAIYKCVGVKLRLYRLHAVVIFSVLLLVIFISRVAVVLLFIHVVFHSSEGRSLVHTSNEHS